MPTTVVGLFSDSKRAGEAVKELVNHGATNDISVISKDEKDGEVTTHDVKSEVSDGTTVGATAGAIMGGLGALLTGVASFFLPGLGLIVLGPLATLLTGIGAGALGGGIVGALVDWGISEETAHMYEERLKAGDVMVGVSTEKVTVEEAKNIFNMYGAQQVQTFSHD